MLHRIRMPAAARGQPAVADWWRFAAAEYRIYHLLALSQGVVLALAGLEVVVPFALDMGCPPALAALLGALPVAGGMAQLVIPRLLARTEGNLRGLTLLAGVIGETRGLAYLLLALLVSAGLLNGTALLLLGLAVLLTGSLGSVTNANLLAWHSAVLAEEDRRLVVPRLMAVSLAIGALFLLPTALVLDALANDFGLVVYAVPFGLAGLLGLAEVQVIRRLPHPGRVTVPPRALSAAAPETPEERQFLKVTMLNALGMGLTPFLSVYAMSVLGLTAGFAMTLGAVGMLTMVVAAAVAGSRLARSSSARMLRNSFAIRALAVALPIAAVPGSWFGPLLLYGSSALGAIGFASGQLAANERLYRLIRGPAVIRQHARYLARTSGAMAAGQLGAAGVLAVGAQLGFPAFALLYGLSSGFRVIAHRLASPDRLADERRRAEPPLPLLQPGRAP